MAGDRIVDRGGDTLCTKPLSDMISMRALNDGEVTVAAGPGGRVHRLDGKLAQRSVVPGRDAPSPVVPGIQPPELDGEDRGLQRIEPMSTADALVPAVVVARASVVAERADSFGQCPVVRHHCAGIAEEHRSSSPGRS